MYTIFLLNITSFVINCSAMRNFLDESLDLTKHRAERYSSVNKTVREIEKKIGHTSQLSFSGENTNYGDSFLLVLMSVVRKMKCFKGRALMNNAM